MPFYASAPHRSRRPPTRRLRPSALDVNRFAQLGAAFFTALPPQPLPDAALGRHERGRCAELLGLARRLAARTDGRARVSSAATRSWPGMRPLATVYSGHQFGVWAGQLGDGRAHPARRGRRRRPGAMELQLKGAGLTPYSRMGDGRAVLRSSIREFLCSRGDGGASASRRRARCASPARTLPVRAREIETAAVVTRVAPSFIRFGHFEHFAHHGDRRRALRTLADFVIERFYPALRDGGRSPYAALLEAVTRRTAELMAQWQAVGFCHGVMNTDNMSILGLTIDYGPFGFLDAFDPGHICNHSDQQGRYAYARQPNVALLEPATRWRRRCCR